MIHLSPLSLILFSASWSLTSGSIIHIWSCMELALLGAGWLFVIEKGSQSSESGIKYLLIQLLGGVMVLLGGWGLTILPYILLAGITLKMGLFPLITWVLQCYKGSSWLMIFLMSTLQKVPLLTLLSSMQVKDLSLGLCTIGTLSVSVALLLNYSISNLKKCLAYSSVAHSGWMVMFSMSGGQPLIYLGMYSLILGDVIREATTLGDHTIQVQSGDMLLSTLSLGGMPPFLGFGLKWYVISAILMSSGALGMALFMISVFSAVWYLWWAMSSVLQKYNYYESLNPWLMYKNSGFTLLWLQI